MSDSNPNWSSTLLNGREGSAGSSSSFGGFGNRQADPTSQRIFEASMKLTSPLVATIATQVQEQPVDISKTMKIKASIRQSNHKHQTQQAKCAYDHVLPRLKCHVNLVKEKGTSSWLSFLPLDDHGFSLHKSAVKDAICLCYGWKLQIAPTKCNCGSVSSLSYRKSWLLSVCAYNTKRDKNMRLTASMHLTRIHSPFITQITWQPLNEHAFERLKNMHLIKICA